MADFKSLYNQMIVEEQRRSDTIKTWNQKNVRLTGGAKERVKDFLQDIGLRKETDFEDQLIDWFAQYIGEIITVISAIVTGGASLPFTTLLLKAGVDEELTGLIEKEIGDKINDNMKKIQQKISPSFNALIWREQLWVIDSLVRGFMYRDIFIDNDYKNFKSGKLNPKSKKGKRIAGRIVFYKTIICKMYYNAGVSQGVPECKFSFNDTPKEFADKYALYLRRYVAESGNGRVNVTQQDYMRVYKVHEFLQNESNAISQKSNEQKLQTGSNIAGIATAIGAILAFKG